jgi:flagellar assembly protein FliH
MSKAVETVSAAPATPAGPAMPSASEIRLQAALREREAELAQLRTQAEKIKADLAAIYADAEKKGYDAGAAKGEKAASQLLQGQIARTKSLLAALEQTRGRVLDEAEDALVEVVYTAVCRVLGEQGATRDAVARLVREAAAGTRDGLIIRLHPDDAALLRAGPEGVEEQARLAADPAVKLGGCLVDSGTGTLDTRFETQLALLGEALLAARAARQPGGDAA